MDCLKAPMIGTALHMIVCLVEQNLDQVDVTAVTNTYKSNNDEVVGTTFVGVQTL